MYKLVLADGMEIPVSMCGLSSAGYLTFRCPKSRLSFIEAAEIFSNVEKTSTITFVYGSMSTVYTGFTEINSIVTDSNLTITLQRGKQHES